MSEIYFFNVNESSFNNTWLPMIVLTVKHGNDRLRKGNTSHGIKSSFLPYIYYQNPQNAP